MALEPITRAEQIMSGESLIPITREEMFLAKAGGQNVATPTPITRREIFLSKISGSSGGGGMVGDDYVVEPPKPPNTIKTYTDTVSTEIADNQFKDFKELTTVYATKVTEIGSHAFDGCYKLTTADFNSYWDGWEVRSVSTIGEFAFASCVSLRNITLSILQQFGGPPGIGQYAFSGCINLEKVDLLNTDSSIAEGTFFGCSSLKTLLLRGDDSTEGRALENVNALEGTQIANGNGYIYVPSKTIDGYQKNWSTFANQFRVLEDYTVDGSIHGELDETKI